MEFKNWEVAGQLWAAQMDLAVFCREAVKNMNVSPDILTWLATTVRGNEVLMSSIASAVSKWKVEVDLADRINEVQVDCEDFKKLVDRCFFIGRDMSINGTNYPLNQVDQEQREYRRTGHPTFFMEIAFDFPVKIGQEKDLMGQRGCRPSTPVEFLCWLNKNQTAGIKTTVNCPTVGEDGNYMSSCLCHGGNRGLHPANRRNGIWSPATVFLGVKLNK